MPLSIRLHGKVVMPFLWCFQPPDNPLLCLDLKTISADFRGIASKKKWNSRERYAIQMDEQAGLAEIHKNIVVRVPFPYSWLSRLLFQVGEIFMNILATRKGSTHTI